MKDDVNLKSTNKKTQFVLKLCDETMEKSENPFEILKIHLTPKVENSAKLNIHKLEINVDYDEADNTKSNKYLSFSPISKHHKKLTQTKSKLSFDNKNEMSIFSKLLKKSCQNLTLNNLKEKTGTNSLYELKISKKVFHENDNIEEILIKVNSSQKLINNLNDSSQSEDNPDIEKSFSNKSDKRVGFDNEEKKALFYCEEDQNLDEMDEQFKKYYVSAVDNFCGNYNIYITNSLMLMNYLPPIDYFQKEIDKRKFKIEISQFKRLMILDLDETLVHVDVNYKFQSHDDYLKLVTDDEIENILPLIIRPYTKEFLEFSSKYFDIVIFTASCKEYADVVLDYLDPKKIYFKYRLYRESCVVYKNLYLKFLDIFNTPIKDCIIVDNSMFSFSYDLSNGILVSSFYQDKEDQDLLSLIEFIEKKLIKTQDVRQELENTFEFTKIKNSLKELSYDEMQNLNIYGD